VGLLIKPIELVSVTLGRRIQPFSAHSRLMLAVGWIRPRTNRLPGKAPARSGRKMPQSILVHLCRETPTKMSSSLRAHHNRAGPPRPHRGTVWTTTWSKSGRYLRYSLASASLTCTSTALKAASQGLLGSLNAKMTEPPQNGFRDRAAIDRYQAGS